MKKFVRIATVVLALSMSLSMVAGCKKDKKDDGKLKVGISIPTLQEERWARDKETMEKACQDAGIEFVSNVADLDAQKQKSQCENMISEGIDVLIIAPHDAAAAAAIVEDAVASGVKVISYDRLITATDKLDLYLSFDNVKVGELQGEYFVNNVDKGNIVVLSGDPEDNNAKLFKQGAMNKLQPKIDSGDYVVLNEQACQDWKAEEALKHTEAALNKSTDIVGILAPNDGTAGGAIQALNKEGLAGSVVVTGQDAELAAAQRILAGEQSMTVFKDTRELGKEAIKIAQDMFAKKELNTQGQVVNNGVKDVPSVLLTPVAVDADNLKSVLIDSGYLKEADVMK